MTESRVVVVTGGAAGIGFDIGRHFARHGWSVVLADRDGVQVQSAALALRNAGWICFDYCMDVRIEQQVEALFESIRVRFKRLDCLCNNAGVESYSRADQCSTSDWDWMQEVNLRGPFLCSRYAFPLLRESRGSIVNISSVQAFANEPNISAYAATKAGLLGLTRSMALDFAVEGVRVNSICPGAIRSGMMDEFFAGQADPVAAEARMGGAIPLGRLGQPKDVSGVAYFLATEDAGYITGASITVDGGLLTRLAL